MTVGFLVNPDLTRRKIEFELEHANQFLGGTTEDRVSVVFQDDGTTYAALYNPEAKQEAPSPTRLHPWHAMPPTRETPPFCKTPSALLAVRSSSWMQRARRTPSMRSSLPSSTASAR